MANSWNPWNGSADRTRVVCHKPLPLGEAAAKQRVRVSGLYFLSNMDHLTAYQKVQLARHPQRPYFLDYVEHLCPDFIELHGDRKFADDAAMVAGFGMFRNG